MRRVTCSMLLLLLFHNDSTAIDYTGNHCSNPRTYSALSKIPLAAMTFGASALGMYYLKKLHTSWRIRIQPEQISETTIAPGVLYRKIIKKHPTPMVIHELIVNPHQARMQPCLSHNTCVASERPSEMSARQKAIAAINGGFFDFGVSPYQDLCIKLLDLIGKAHYNAFPVYACKIAGKWLSLSHQPTGVIAWDDTSKSVTIGVAHTECTLYINGERPQEFRVRDLNKPNLQYPVIYTDQYGDTTPTGKDIQSLIINNNHVIDMQSGGGISVKEGTYVYAQKGGIEGVSLGDPVTLVMKHISDDPQIVINLDTLPHAIGSTPLLIHNGSITETVQYSTSSFYTKLHPRTAIGLLDDGSWLLVVVDGRQAMSAGMSLSDLASYLKERGCTEALNLDGGGSSTMVIGNQTANVPSGREYSIVTGERPIATGIIVVSPSATSES